MWVPPEFKDPVLEHAPTRKSIACFGAVSLRTGKFVHAMKEVFDAQTFHVSALNTAAIAALTADQVSQVWMGQVRALNVT